MGRKFWITAFGIASVVVLAVLAILKGFPSPDSAFGALAAMVLGFCGGNAAATFAHSGTASQSSTVTVERTVKTPAAAEAPE